MSKVRDFKELEFINSLWHDYTEKPQPGPNGDRLILMWNPDTTDYDIAWLGGVPKEYYWVYMDEILTPEMVEKLYAYERELDKEHQ